MFSKRIYTLSILLVAISALVIRETTAWTPTFSRRNDVSVQNSRTSTRLYLSSKVDTVEKKKAANDQISLLENVQDNDSNAYVEFAKNYPFANNLLIATAKTAAND